MRRPFGVFSSTDPSFVQLNLPAKNILVSPVHAGEDQGTGGVRELSEPRDAMSGEAFVYLRHSISSRASNDPHNTWLASPREFPWIFIGAVWSGHKLRRQLLRSRSRSQPVEGWTGLREPVEGWAGLR